MRLSKDAQIINMVDLIGRVKKCLNDKDWKLLEMLLKDLKTTHESGKGSDESR